MILIRKCQKPFNVEIDSEYFSARFRFKTWRGNVLFQLWFNEKYENIRDKIKEPFFEIFDIGLLRVVREKIFTKFSSNS